MTTKSSSVSPVRVLRSSLRLSLPLAVMSSVVLAQPAMADLPEAWETPETASFGDILLFTLAIPLGAAVVIVLLTLLPGLIRGEKLSEPALPRSDEWFGGPRGGKAEIESGAAKDAGGASGQW